MIVLGSSCSSPDSSEDIDFVTIGIILLVIGVVLAILGSAGRPVGGRRHYF